MVKKSISKTNESFNDNSHSEGEGDIRNLKNNIKTLLIKHSTSFRDRLRIMYIIEKKQTQRDEQAKREIEQKENKKIENILPDIKQMQSEQRSRLGRKIKN